MPKKVPIISVPNKYLSNNNETQKDKNAILSCAQLLN